MQSSDIAFLLLALLAEIIGTLGGFGSSVFFVPLATLYFNFQTVLAITALFHVASNLSKIMLFKSGIDRRLLVYLGIPAVAFVILGGWASKYLKSDYPELTLGIFLISMSLFFLIKDKFELKTRKREAIIGGSLSGFIAGILGTGGAIRGLTMAAFNLEKSAFVATSAVIDMGVDSSRTVVYYFNGYYNLQQVIYIPFLVAIAILGSWIGKILLRRISQQYFKRFSLFLILAIGVMTVLRFFVKVA